MAVCPFAGIVSEGQASKRMVPASRLQSPPQSIQVEDDGYLQWMLKSFFESSTSIAKSQMNAEAEKLIYSSLLRDLKSCSVKRDLQWGRRIHVKAMESRHDSSMYIVTALIKMYGKCSSMVDARRAFDRIHKPDVVCWTALLLGYVENGDGLATLELFAQMKASGCAPDYVSYVAALKACTTLAGKRDDDGRSECLRLGRGIHFEIGCHLNIVVQNTLIDMYSKCRSMSDARTVFDHIRRPDVVSWNALISGYAENGDGLAALKLFSGMKSCGCAPDSLTYIASLKACTSLVGKPERSGQSECLKWGRDIHSEIGCDLDIFLQSTLIDMYTKCGSMVDARRVFDCIEKPNVVSWTALLQGYAENGQGLAALELFSKMKACGCEPDSVTYIAVLKACTLTGALSLGRKLHSEISKFTANVVTCLVDFYAKCGSIIEARATFDAHSTARNISTWTALLTGYGSFGDTVSVFNLFEAMQDQGFQPDAVTFVCLLSCCSHAGLVEKAQKYFEAMPMQYGVTHTVMHYTCMVDVLGRSNQLNEATALLRKMPCNPNAVTWMTLLGACHKWKNVETGRCALQSLVEMDKKIAPSYVAAAYVLMAHIYGSRGMWDEQQKALEARKELGVWKLPEQAYVYDEVGNMVKFVVKEEDHPKVRNKLEQLLKACGYVAEVSCNVPVECGHNERQAVVYGILNIPDGEPVRAFKDTRMCDDCHGLIKMISKQSGRSVIVRDASRLHVMMNGSCSCGDYW